MRLVRTMSLICFALVLTAGTASAGGDVSLLIGHKSAGEGLFDDAGIEDQTLTGVAVNLDFDWPVLLAVDLVTSSDEGDVRFEALEPVRVDTEVETLEIDLGVRKTFGERVVPYVGAGVAWCQMDVDQTVTGSLGSGSEFTDTVLDDSDSDFGFWVGAGLLWRVGEHFQVGVDARHTSAKPKLTPVGEDTDVKLQAGGNHFSAFFGYRW